MKYIIAILLLAVAFFGYRYYQAPVADQIDSAITESLQIQESTDAYSIDINITPSGLEKIDTEIALVNAIEMIEFKTVASSSQTASSSAQYELVKTSEKFSSSDTLKLDTIVVSRYEYTGGAHGNTTYDTYTYGKTKGLQYDIENILEKSPELDQLIIDRTIAVITAKDSQADTELVSSAVSNWDNLQDFYLNGDTLVFLFAPYVVGPYSLGTQTVQLQMQELLPYARGSVQTAYGYAKPASQATTTATTTAN